MANGNFVHLCWICELVFMGKWKLLKSWHQDYACGNLLSDATELDLG